MDNRRTSKMRTVRTKVYKFNELSEQAKQKAIDTFRSNNNGVNFYAEDICNSAKKVIELFNLKTGNEYSDIRTSHIDDNILQLSGVRLYKYIINNYYSDLFTPAYIKTIYKEWHCKLFICKLKTGRDGNKYTQVYSKTKKDNSCVLTGVCYDMDILEPIYKFLEKPSKGTTFEDLMNEIGNAISKTYSDNDEWVNSDEFITETIESNDYEFTQDGRRF